MIKSVSLLLALALMGCTTEPGSGNVTVTENQSEAQHQPAEQPRELNMETAAQQANDFAMRFYGQVAGEESGNLFFSPLSIHSALSMTFAGSKGETAREMGNVLAFAYAPDEGIEHHAYSMLLKALNDAPTVRIETYENNEQKTIERPAFELVVANRLWGQQGFPWNAGFKQLTEREYLAGLEEVNFEADADGAADIINDWVENTTRDRIKDLIPRGTLDAYTRLVLTNAIYFKANWMEEFNDSMTKPRPFHLANGETVDVPTMSQTEHFNYGETPDSQLLEMRYERGALSMLVVLPIEDEGAMAAVEQQLASGELLIEMSAMQRTKVDVALPKFRLEQELDLNATLSAMGMPIAFSNQANFSGMTSAETLFLSKALHKAFVEVDEKGTEAAAATAIEMSFTSMPPPETPKIFHADRPFLFLIRHNESGAILFMGRVTDPR